MAVTTKAQLRRLLAEEQERNRALRASIQTTVKPPRFTALRAVIVAVREVGLAADRDAVLRRAADILAEGGGHANASALAFALGQVRQALAAGMALGTNGETETKAEAEIEAKEAEAEAEAETIEAEEAE